MMRLLRIVCGLVLLGCLAVVNPGPLRADDGKGVDARTAFQKMKSLAGEWKVEGGDHGPGTIVYKVTSNGSVVMQTFFPGSEHEMVSMYHLDGDELKMTHYCAFKNQPRVKLDKAASTPESLVFAFDGGTNFDPSKDAHMHSGRIKFLEGGKVEEQWDGYAEGKKNHTVSFALSKK